MARYDVHANPATNERRHTPYLLDVQNDFIDGLLSRVVIPLRRESVFGPPARHLTPLFEVKGERVILDTAAMGAVPLSVLRPPVATLREHRAEVQEAMDTLFGAY